MAALLKAADLIEAEHRGLTWEKVAMIRASDRSALSLARELRVSDTLIRRVRNGELWKTGAEDRNRNDVPRRVVVETLVFAGLRISEFCGLDAHHLDVAAGRLRVPRGATKTDAGERVIPTSPGTPGAADRAPDGLPGAAKRRRPSRPKARQNPDNVRSRVLNPVRERANELVAADGRPPIGHMTPHTLRRTFASVVAVCDVSPRRAMYLIGHTHPTLTLGVYQQVMDVGRRRPGPPRRPHRMLSPGRQVAPRQQLAARSSRNDPGTDVPSARIRSRRPDLRDTKGPEIRAFLRSG